MNQAATTTAALTAPSSRWLMVAFCLIALAAVFAIGWPLLVLAGSTAAVALLWRARSLWWLLAALLAFLPFGLWPILTGGEDIGRDFSSTGMIKDLVHILVAVVIIGRSLAGRETRLGATPLNYLFLAYLGWIGIHFVNPSAPIPGFWSWRLYIEFVVFYLLAQLALRDLHDVRRVLLVWFLLAIPLVGYSIEIMVSGRIWEYYQESVLGAGARLSLGGLVSTNYLALLLLPSVLGALGMAWSEPNRRRKTEWLVLAAISLLLLVLTISRRAYLATLVGLAILGLFTRRKLWLGLGVGALVGSLPFLPEGIWQRFSSITSLTEYSNVARLQEWQTLLRMIFTDPLSALWGLGAGSVGVAAVNYGVPGAVYGHNSYLVQFAELGLIGLVFFLILLGWHLVLAYRLARDHRGLVLGKTAALLLAILGAYSFTGLFGITFHTYPMNMLAWLTMGMIQALWRQAHPVAPITLTAAAGPISRQWRRGVVAVTLTTVAIYAGSYLLPRQYRASAQVMVAADTPAMLTLGDEPNPFVLAFSDEPNPPNYKEELRVYNALRSKAAIHAAFEELELLPALFPERWDQRAQRWRGTPPTPSQTHERVWHKRVFVDWQPLAGKLRVTVQWTDPKGAAALANAVVRHGDRLAVAGMRDFALAKSAAFTKIITEMKERLHLTEEERAAFLREQELASARSQSTVALSLWSKNQRRLLDTQLERALAATSLSANHPYARALNAKWVARRQVDQKMRRGEYPGLPAIDELPVINGRARHLRKTIWIYDQLTPMVEPLAALWRVRTQIDGAALVVYDPAVPPWQRVAPARVFLAAAGAAFVGYVWLLWVYLAPRRRKEAKGT